VRPDLRALGALGALAALLTGAAGAAGAGAAPSSSLAPVSSQLHWHSCDAYDESFLCSELAVPIDYAHPADGNLELALVERPASDTPVLGDIVINPGGPGDSGVQYLESESFYFPAELTEHFNLVSFDPRGVGQSDPVSCVGASVLVHNVLNFDPDPVTAAQAATLVSSDKAFARACAEHTSMTLLENVGTANAARDLDRIRVALGQSKLDYLGLGYGTYLGELYDEQYPSRVGAMVLDGVVDPALSSTALSQQRAQALQGELGDFFAWCDGSSLGRLQATWPCRATLPQGAEPAYHQLMARLADGYRPDAELPPVDGEAQKVTLGVADLAVAALLPYPGDWTDLAQAIEEALVGYGGALVSAAYSLSGVTADGQLSSNYAAADTAIGCADGIYTSEVTADEHLAARLAKTAPDFVFEAWVGSGCAYWLLKAGHKRAEVHVAGGRPVLLIGSTGDPSTPYSWAQAVARQLGDARLLTRDGPGHTAYFNSTCVQTWTDQFFATRTLPPKGTVCNSNNLNVIEP
jgi:pimeloyl-ACP methyl ester carboxylesterase